MLSIMKESAKRSAGWILSRSDARYRYEKCIFMLAHMRCGSTALSNILVSRADISGYGEAHIRYDGLGALGRLGVNQMRRDGFRPDASYLFDKILHNRHDSHVPADFFDARAIFVVRRPGDAIRSIVSLFRKLQRDEYADFDRAAAYYVERLDALLALWRRFPAHRRIGLTHEQLLVDPDAALLNISTRLGFDPPLTNHYVSPQASRRGGGGDPLQSGQYSRIEPLLNNFQENDFVLPLSDRIVEDARRRYEHMKSAFSD